MDYEDISDNDEFGSPGDRRMTRVIHPRDVPPTGNATAKDTAPSGDSSFGTSPNASMSGDFVEKVKNMTEGQIQELLFKINLNDDSDTVDEFGVENEEADVSDVEEKRQAKPQKKKDPVQPKKTTKKNAKKNNPLPSEQQHDIAFVIPVVTVEPSQADAKPKKPKRGKKEENNIPVSPKDDVIKSKNDHALDETSAVEGKQNKPKRSPKGKQNKTKHIDLEPQSDLHYKLSDEAPKGDVIKSKIDHALDEKSSVEGKQNKPKRSPKGKQNKAKDVDLESKPDLHYKLSDESDGKDVKSNSENNTKSKTNLKKATQAHKTVSQDKTVDDKKQNIEDPKKKDFTKENSPRKPLKRDIKSSMEEKVEVSKDSESSSTRSTKAKKKNTTNVLKGIEESKKKEEPTIEGQTSELVEAEVEVFKNSTSSSTRSTRAKPKNASNVLKDIEESKNKKEPTIEYQTSELKVKNVKKDTKKNAENMANESVVKPKRTVKQKLVEAPSVIINNAEKEIPKSKANPVKAKTITGNKENKTNENVVAPKRTARKK